MKVKVLVTQLCPVSVTLQTVAPQSMEFYRQEYWSGLLFPSPEDLPNFGTGSSTLQADSLPSKPPGKSHPSLSVQFSSVQLLSRVQLFATPWTVAPQAPLYMEIPRPEYWSGLPFPSPWDCPNPGTERRSPALQADSLPSESPGKPINKVRKKIRGLPIVFVFYSV